MFLSSRRHIDEGASAALCLAAFLGPSVYGEQSAAQPQSSPPPVTVPQSAPASTGARRLTLADAEQLALKNNPRIGESQFQERAYEEVVREFRAAYLPSLTGNITAVGADSGTRLAAGALNNPIVYSRVGTGVTMSQTVTDFGRTQSLLRSAFLNAQAQEQAVNFTKADIILQTDGAYLGVLRERALLSVARETVQTRQLLADQVSALFQNKLKSSLDLSFAHVNLADAKLLLSDTENNVQSAQAELARILALPNDVQFDLVDPGLSNERVQSPMRSSNSLCRNAPICCRKDYKCSPRSNSLGQNSGFSSYGWPRWHRRLCSCRRTSITGHLRRRWCKSQHPDLQRRFIQGAPVRSRGKSGRCRPALARR